MNTKIPNIEVIRSTWRRVKRDIKDAIIRDLKRVKDVKGGSGSTGGTDATATTSTWDYVPKRDPSPMRSAEDPDFDKGVAIARAEQPPLAGGTRFGAITSPLFELRPRACAVSITLPAALSKSLASR